MFLYRLCLCILFGSFFIGQGIGRLYAFGPLDDLIQDVGACIVINAKNGHILLAKEIHKPLYPASCSKIATLAYIISNPHLNLDTVITVPQEAVRIVRDSEKAKDNFSKYPSYVQEATGSSAHLVAFEKITIRDALYGMMLVSGNDAANALSFHFGNGSMDFFLKNMQLFVTKLGCRETHFMNPHGLHHPDHLSSAYDLALIARYGMTLPLFRTIVGSKSYTKPKTNKQEAVVWYQSNKLMRPGRFYSDLATGIKTGRHMRAMENLVASGQKDGREVIVVLLRCPEPGQRFDYAKRIMAHYLGEKEVEKSYLTKGVIQMTMEVPGATPLPLRVEEGFSLKFYPSEEPQVRIAVAWQSTGFSIQKNDPVGELQFYVDDVLKKSILLRAAEDRKITIPRLVSSFASSFFKDETKKEGSSYSFFVIGSIAIIGVVFGNFFFRRRRRGINKKSW